MGVKFSPIGNGTNWIPGSGLIANGYKLFFYAAGTTTKQNTYTTYTGGTANDNPIVLNAYGRPANEIWLTEGVSYKVVIASGSDTDPPASGITLGDYITGINDSGDIGLDQWVVYGSAPTYISTTSFSVTGDQTATFHIGRRVKTTNTGGTIYSTITNSVYGALTTVTVVNDSGTLDAGLSAVSYGILSSTNPSVPKVLLPDGSTVATQTQNDNSTKIASTAYVDASRQSSINDFRLTLTTAVPVTTSDVTGATTIYCTPYIGNRISLYDGSNWKQYTSAEFSLALGTITSDQGYDVFCYANAGVPTLEFLAWTNNTTRATALVMQDGVLCKTGQLTRRYLGSFLTTATTTTEDSDAKRYLFNYYNRATRRMLAVDNTASWTYTTAVWRQSNNSSTNQVNFFVGYVDQSISVTSMETTTNSSSSIERSSGIGINSTSSPSQKTGAMVADLNSQISATNNVVFYPSLGKNYAARLEYSAAAGTTTWYGVSGIYLTNITGELLA